MHIGAGQKYQKNIRYLLLKGKLKEAAIWEVAFFLGGVKYCYGVLKENPSTETLASTTKTRKSQSLKIMVDIDGNNGLYFNIVGFRNKHVADVKKFEELILRE